MNHNSRCYLNVPMPQSWRDQLTTNHCDIIAGQTQLAAQEAWCRWQREQAIAATNMLVITQGLCLGEVPSMLTVRASQ